jgi:hypothetical protein
VTRIGCARAKKTKAKTPGETEQELIDRATLAVKRTPWGVGYLMMDDLMDLAFVSPIDARL